MIVTKLVCPFCPLQFTRRRIGTYDEQCYDKSHIFAHVRKGQAAGSKKFNNKTYVNSDRAISVYLCVNSDEALPVYLCVNIHIVISVHFRLEQRQRSFH